MEGLRRQAIKGSKFGDGKVHHDDPSRRIVGLRYARGDGNKHGDSIAKTMSEDELKKLKDEIQRLTKTYEEKIDAALGEKTKELTTM